MANQPIQGYSGTVTINAIGTAWIKKWDANFETDQKDLGPFAKMSGTI